MEPEGPTFGERFQTFCTALGYGPGTQSYRLARGQIRRELSFIFLLAFEERAERTDKIRWRERQDPLLQHWARRDRYAAAFFRYLFVAHDMTQDPIPANIGTPVYRASQVADMYHISDLFDHDHAGRERRQIGRLTVALALMGETSKSMPLLRRGGLNALIDRDPAMARALHLTEVWKLTPHFGDLLVMTRRQVQKPIPLPAEREPLTQGTIARLVTEMVRPVRTHAGRCVAGLNLTGRYISQTQKAGKYSVYGPGRPLLEELEVVLGEALQRGV